MRRVSLWAWLLCVAAAASVTAVPQFDAPFEALRHTHAAARRLAGLWGRFGARPNIIYVLADDVGWGEVGFQGGGMRFWSAYAEHSCTPSRVALTTGRHGVRAGLANDLLPGATEGLSSEEVTVASVLKKAGYATGMWGKWHLGELFEHAPERHGFDYAYYSVFDGMVDTWPAHTDFPGFEVYERDSGVDLRTAAYVGESGQGRSPLGGIEGTLGAGRQGAFEKESISQIKSWITAQAETQEPFFIYWATQLCGATQQGANNQAMAQHNVHLADLRSHLQARGLSENTLIVWYSDNGPNYDLNTGSSWLRGGQGDVLEGGVRVPALAVWPGMIAPDQDPTDLIHLTDLFTTACRLANATHLAPRRPRSRRRRRHAAAFERRGPISQADHVPLLWDRARRRAPRRLQSAPRPRRQVVQRPARPGRESSRARLVRRAAAAARCSGARRDGPPLPAPNGGGGRGGRVGDCALRGLAPRRPRVADGRHKGHRRRAHRGHGPLLRGIPRSPNCEGGPENR
ncbi:alkaline-phosphatase-like protein, partial [Pelagophyceae sp. CCMP2097]